MIFHTSEILIIMYIIIFGNNHITRNLNS